jgi:hypothetical protein
MILDLLTLYFESYFSLYTDREAAKTKEVAVVQETETNVIVLRYCLALFTQLCVCRSQCITRIQMVVQRIWGDGWSAEKRGKCLHVFGHSCTIMLLVTIIPYIASKRVLDSNARDTCLLWEQSVSCSVVTGKPCKLFCSYWQTMASFRIA